MKSHNYVVAFGATMSIKKTLAPVDGLTVFGSMAKAQAEAINHMRRSIKGHRDAIRMVRSLKASDIT